MSIWGHYSFLGYQQTLFCVRQLVIWQTGERESLANQHFPQMTRDWLCSDTDMSLLQLMVPFSDLLILGGIYCGEGVLFAVIPHLCQDTL